jgi:site-specific recombinase XerD
LPRRISQQALADVWNCAATSRYGVHRWTWVTVFGVLYGTGARRGEIARLDVADWDREEQLLLFDGRKSRRERRAPVPSLLSRCLEAYLPQRHNLLESLGRTDEPALFVNRFGMRMSLNGISSGMKRVAQRAGHERISLHQFRHSCASDLLNGVSGWCSIARTPDDRHDRALPI